MRGVRQFLRAALLALGLSLPGAASAQYESCRPVFTAQPPAVNACADNTRFRIAVVGDILLHSPLQRQAYAQGFDTLWGAAVPFLRSADFAIANLEGPVAPGIRRSGGQGTDPGAVFDGSVYTSYPMFNYHNSLLPALKTAGIDLVTTANNHALDRFAQGADATIAELRRAGLPFVGTVPRQGDRNFAYETNTRIGRIVWIACTFSTNGIPDREGQTLHCYQQREALLRLVAGHAARREVAGVIVLPHWGNEYQTRAAGAERSLSRDLISAGATAVIGTHPHVVQDWDIIGAGGINVPVIYSTGNFVSGQVGLDKQTGILAWVELCRSRPSADLGQAAVHRGGAAVATAGWVALRMARTQNGRMLIMADQNGVHEAALPSHRLVEGRVPGRALMPRLQCGGYTATTGIALQ